MSWVKKKSKFVFSFVCIIILVMIILFYQNTSIFFSTELTAILNQANGGQFLNIADDACVYIQMDTPTDSLNMYDIYTSYYRQGKYLQILPIDAQYSLYYNNTTLFYENSANKIFSYNFINKETNLIFDGTATQFFFSNNMFYLLGKKDSDDELSLYFLNSMEEWEKIIIRKNEINQFIFPIQNGILLCSTSAFESHLYHISEEGDITLLYSFPDILYRFFLVEDHLYTVSEYAITRYDFLNNYTIHNPVQIVNAEEDAISIDDTINIVGNDLIYQTSAGVFSYNLVSGKTKKISSGQYSAIYVVNEKLIGVIFGNNIQYMRLK